MARIRSVHPGFWSDETIVCLKVETRLFLIGLWNECDDQGAFEWKPLGLKMRIFPADNFDVAAMLSELEGADVVKSYEIGGRKFGAVRNFSKFQRPKKPNSVHPMPGEFRTYAGLSVTSSEPVPHQLPTSSEIPPQMEDGGGIGGKEESSSLRSDVPRLRRKQVPKDWQPDAKGVAFAEERNVNVAAEVPRFRDYHASKGSLFADVQAAWRTWCQNQQRFNGTKPHNRHASLQLAPVSDDPTGIIAWIAKQETHLGTWQDRKVPCINGCPLEATAEQLTEAIIGAGGELAARPNWDALAAWCREDLLEHEAAWDSIRRVTKGLSGPVRSLAVFDQAIRETGRRAA